MLTTMAETRCLFCSLCCPAGVAFGEMGLSEPAYPGHAPPAHHGLCYRGHFLSDLAAHPGRMVGAVARDDGSVRSVPPREALRRVAELLPGMRGEAAVAIDGNVPCEELAEAVRLARVGLGIERVAVYVPPADEQVLRGLAASAARPLGEEELAHCDVILAVGDPFATHPPIAAPVLDALARARGNRLINLDSVRGRTARFATDFCLVPPGGEARALAESEAGRLAGMVSNAERLGVLLSLPDGRCSAPAAAASLAAKLAQAHGGGVCPLLTYGNANGALRLGTALKATPLAQLLAELRAGKVRNLIVLGTDLLSALPVRELDSAQIVLAASALPSATTERARCAVPMALWFEIGGRVVDGSGERREAAAIGPPCGGALTPSQVLRALGAAEVPELSEGELAAMLATAPEAGECGVRSAECGVKSESGRLALVPAADSVGFADGSLSTQLAWPALVEPQPVLRLHPSDAQALGAPVAMVRSNGAAVRLAVAASQDVPRGVATVSAHFPETRALFAWGARGAGPALVALEKCSGND